MPNTQEMQKIDLVRGEVRYTIHVEVGDDGKKWGTWECRECHVGGTTDRSVIDLDRAIEASKTALERHHMISHQT